MITAGNLNANISIGTKCLTTTTTLCSLLVKPLIVSVVQRRHLKSENWIIRIFKVKDLDNLGRDHSNAVAFDKGLKRKRAAKRKGPRVLRTE